MWLSDKQTENQLRERIRILEKGVVRGLPELLEWMEVFTKMYGDLPPPMVTKMVISQWMAEDKKHNQL